MSVIVDSGHLSMLQRQVVTQGLSSSSWNGKSHHMPEGRLTMTYFSTLGTIYLLCLQIWWNFWPTPLPLLSIIALNKSLPFPSFTRFLRWGLGRGVDKKQVLRERRDEQQRWHLSIYSPLLAFLCHHPPENHLSFLSFLMPSDNFLSSTYQTLFYFFF